MKKNGKEIAELIPFYHQLGLPISLKEMDMDLTEAEYQVAERACIEGETIHYMKQKLP